MNRNGLDIFFILAFSLTQTCCTPGAVSTTTPGATDKTTQPGTSTPTYTQTPSLTSTPQPTFTAIPTLPPLVTTPISEELQEIDAKNINALTKLASWGDGQLYSLLLIEDGEKVVAVLSTGVRVFDAQGLQQLSRLDIEIPNEYPVNWAISPDGRNFVLLDWNAKITVWQLGNGSKIAERQFDREQDIGCAQNFVISNNNDTLGIFGYCEWYPPASRLLMVRISDLTVMLKLEGIGIGRFSPDGQYLATYSHGTNDLENERTVKLWKTTNGQLAHKFAGDGEISCDKTYRGGPDNPWPSVALWGDETSCVEFSPDNTELAVSHQNALYLYKVQDGSRLATFPAGRPWFSANGQLLFRDNHTQTAGYDLNNNDQAINYPNILLNPVLSPDKSLLAGTWESSSTPKSINFILLNLNDGSNVLQITGYIGSVFSPDSKYISLYSNSPYFKPTLLISTSDGKTIQTLDTEVSPSFSPDGKYLITLSGNQIIVRNLPDGEIRYTLSGAVYPYMLKDGISFLTLEGNNILRRSLSDGAVMAAHAFPISPKLLVSAGNSIMETSMTGTRIFSLPQLSYQKVMSASAVFSPDNLHYAVSKPGQVEIWRQDEPNQPVTIIPTGGHGIFAFSPRGDLIAIAKTNGDLEIRGVDNEELLNTFTIGTSKRILAIAFTTDDSKILVTTYNFSSKSCSTLRWNLEDGQKLPSREITCNHHITISPDSKLLAYSGDNEITIVQLQGWQPFQTIKNHYLITQMSFSPDGKLLAGVSPRTDEFYIWDIESANLEIFCCITRYEYYLSNYQDDVSISFSSDGRYILFTTAGQASLWGIPASAEIPPPTPTIPSIKGISWVFSHEGDQPGYSAGDLQGWLAWHQISEFWTTHNGLHGISRGNDPYIGSPEINIDAKAYPLVTIRMKVFKSSAAQLFWMTSSDKNFSESNSLRFPVTGDGVSHTYSFSMTNLGGWNNKIIRVRFDPMETIGFFVIEYIQIHAP